MFPTTGRLAHTVRRVITSVPTLTLAAGLVLTGGAVTGTHVAQTTQVAQRDVASLAVHLDGQIDRAAELASVLDDQVVEAQTVLADSEGKVAKDSTSPADLEPVIAHAEARAATLDKLAAAGTKVAKGIDADAWIPWVVSDQRDSLQSALTPLVTATTAASRDESLTEAVAAVTAEVEAKAAADKKAAEEKAAREKAAAEKKAAEEAAAEQTTADQAATWTDHGIGGGTYTDSGAQQAPAANSGEGRAHAEALVAQFGGGSVQWVDLGAYGQAASGLVMVGARSGIAQLSSGTDDSFWFQPLGAAVAVHEGHHLAHDRLMTQISNDLGIGYDQQFAAMEQAADCATQMSGYSMTGYGCSDPVAKQIASYIISH